MSLFPLRNAARCWASTMFHVEHCNFEMFHVEHCLVHPLHLSYPQRSPFLTFGGQLHHSRNVAVSTTQCRPMSGLDNVPRGTLPLRPILPVTHNSARCLLSA